MRISDGGMDSTTFSHGGGTSSTLATVRTARFFCAVRKTRAALKCLAMSIGLKEQAALVSQNITGFKDFYRSLCSRFGWCS